MGANPVRYTHMQTPKGVRDFVGPEAAAKRAVEDAFRQTFARWGYEEVITPTVEFFEALALGDGPDLSDKMFRFFDREGNMLALRPEMTTPIGRVVAARLQDAPKPLRLFYVANVFRYEERRIGRGREFWQAGVELIGSASAAADAEVIALALAALDAAGLESFRVDVGQVGYFHGLLEEAGLEGEARRAVRRALLRRDYVALEEALEETSLPGRVVDALRRLPRLRGGMDVLDEALALSDHPRAREAVESLRDVMGVLADYGVADRVGIDLGMIKDLDYYTGMVLEGYSEAVAFPLCTGGRYDGLLGRFGYPCPATGFVVGVEGVLLALERARGADGDGPGSRVSSGPRWLVSAADGTARPAALAAVRRLREAGERVEADVECLDGERLAAHAKARGVEAVVRFDSPDGPPVVDGPRELRDWFLSLWREQ